MKKPALNARTLDDFGHFVESITETTATLETTRRPQLLSLLTPNFQDFRNAQVSPV